jgi:hypothetical protein
MKHEIAWAWLLNNSDLFESAKPLGDRRDQYFLVHNTLTGQNKRTTSCGRCLAGMRNTMKNLKIQYQSMKEYKIYRTLKGNLSFKVQGESIMSIHASTDLTAKDALLGLKAFEKRENKKIENL